MGYADKELIDSKKRVGMAAARVYQMKKTIFVDWATFLMRAKLDVL